MRPDRARVKTRYSNLTLLAYPSARARMYVCMHVCVCVRVRCVFVCARARVSHEMMMDPYVARLFLSTNERKGEKDREEKRASRDIVKTKIRTYCLSYPTSTTRGVTHTEPDEIFN